MLGAGGFERSRAELQAELPGLPVAQGIAGTRA